MIKLFDNGAYLLHGTELVEDNAEAGVRFSHQSLAVLHQRKRHQRTHLLTEYWLSITHLTIWRILRSNSIR